MIKSLIEKIVNIWDPLGVYGLAPEDEYDDITAKLIKLMESSASEEEIKGYLILQYYSENAKNEAKVNELYEIIKFLN